MPVEPADRLTHGHRFEEVARRHLESNGLLLLSHNFRARGGEVDLIMTEHSTVVFVEVRSRSSASVVDPAATVTPAKQRRVILAAQWFLTRHPRLASRPCRFDVVGITGSIERHEVTWIKAAFTA